MDNKIETIPSTMEKFFGCSGKMIKPSANTVSAIVKKIRKGRVVTLDQLRERLANDFNVQAACPASTTKALQILAKEDKPVCYWRVVKKNGELIAKFPKGVEGHGALLESDGVEIDFNKKSPVVVEYKKRLDKLT